MHYYSFNIADYKKDTDHLSIIEHYIYRSLIDRYYLDEKPIIKDRKELARRLRLYDQDSKELLENVLSDFFYEADDGFRHKRIDSEIQQYQDNAEKNRKNGKKGGRPPKKEPKDNPMGCQSVANDNPMATQSKGNQELVTINQELVTKKEDGATDFDLIYESIKTQLQSSGILPVAKPVNKDELKPEVYKFNHWCDENNVAESKRVKSAISWFQRIDKEDRKRFYTFPNEVNHNYYTGSTETKAPKVTDEAAAAIRAKFMGVMGL